MNKTGIIITTLHRVVGIQLPRSYGQKPYQYPPSYTPFQDQPIDLEKSYEAFLESTRQIQNPTDSQAYQDFQIQDPYSIFKSQYKKKNLRT